MRTESHRLATAGMFSALGTVFLCLGSLIPIATYASPVLASLAVMIVAEECGKRWAWCSYAVVAILSLLLAPDKEAAAVFLVLGYYPLLKPALDRLKPLPRILAKLTLCVAAVGGLYALLIRVLQLEALVQEFRTTGTLLLGITVLLGLATFFVYDMALLRLAALYRRKRRKGNEPGNYRG